MNLEDSPVRETSFGMVQIQSKLDDMSLQIQDIKKGKEFHQDIWCTRCRTKGHHKDQCLAFHHYLTVGAPKPLSQSRIPWCGVFQTRGHKSEECLYLDKIVELPQQVFIVKFFYLCVMMKRTVEHTNLLRIEQSILIQWR